MLLPKLESLMLLDDEPQLHLCASTPIDGMALATMVASRKACAKGLSFREVVSCASGLLQSSGAAPSDDKPAFQSSKSCSQITWLISDPPVKANDSITSWLKDNVRTLEIK